MPITLPAWSHARFISCTSVYRETGQGAKAVRTLSLSEYPRCGSTKNAPTAGRGVAMLKLEGNLVAAQDAVDPACFLAVLRSLCRAIVLCFLYPLLCILFV